MRTRVPQRINLYRTLNGIAVATLIIGCAHASSGRSTPVAASPSNSFYGLASSSVRSATVYETHTPSVALDRIDQRTLPLDQTYRHPGTGKGVTVYVFDGGISATHPELAGRVRAGFSGF